MITVNLDKAKEIHRGHIRMARVGLLRKLDIEFQRALETEQDTSNIVHRKNQLRDAPQDPSIDSATSTSQLKSSWNASLLGPSPYRQV